MVYLVFYSAYFKRYILSHYPYTVCNIIKWRIIQDTSTKHKINQLGLMMASTLNDKCEYTTCSPLPYFSMLCSPQSHRFCVQQSGRIWLELQTQPHINSLHPSLQFIALLPILSFLQLSILQKGQERKSHCKSLLKLLKIYQILSSVAATFSSQDRCQGKLGF